MNRTCIPCCSSRWPAIKWRIKHWMECDLAVSHFCAIQGIGRAYIITGKPEYLARLLEWKAEWTAYATTPADFSVLAAIQSVIEGSAVIDLNWVLSQIAAAAKRGHFRVRIWCVLDTAFINRLVCMGYSVFSKKDQTTIAWGSVPAGRQYVMEEAYVQISKDGKVVTEPEEDDSSSEPDDHEPQTPSD